MFDNLKTKDQIQVETSEGISRTGTIGTTGPDYITAHVGDDQWCFNRATGKVDGCEWPRLGAERPIWPVAELAAVEGTEIQPPTALIDYDAMDPEKLLAQARQTIQNTLEDLNAATGGEALDLAAAVKDVRALVDERDNWKATAEDHLKNLSAATGKANMFQEWLESAQAANRRHNDLIGGIRTVARNYWQDGPEELAALTAVLRMREMLDDAVRQVNEYEARDV